MSIWAFVSTRYNSYTQQVSITAMETIILDTDYILRVLYKVVYAMLVIYLRSWIITMAYMESALWSLIYTKSDSQKQSDKQSFILTESEWILVTSVYASDRDCWWPDSRVKRCDKVENPSTSCKWRVTFFFWATANRNTSRAHMILSQLTQGPVVFVLYIPRRPAFVAACCSGWLPLQSRC